MMTSETDAEFLDRLEATPRYNPAYRTLVSDRLFALARRGAAVQQPCPETCEPSRGQHHINCPNIAKAYATPRQQERRMSDIVKRLRAEATDNRRYEVSGTLATEAADRIEQLEAEVKVWQGHAKTAIWSDSEECKFLTARIEQLEAALREIIIHCDWPDRVEKYARAALEDRT